MGKNAESLELSLKSCYRDAAKETDLISVFITDNMCIYINVTYEFRIDWNSFDVILRLFIDQPGGWFDHVWY